MNKIETSNWFTDSLPFEIGSRLDGKFNVWNMTLVHFDDDDPEFKWQVIKVCDTEAEAKEFVGKQ
jgi:hypothetical protein